jgi:hypothetical protein
MEVVRLPLDRSPVPGLLARGTCLIDHDVFRYLCVRIGGRTGDELSEARRVTLYDRLRIRKQYLPLP